MSAHYDGNLDFLRRQKQAMERQKIHWAVNDGVLRWVEGERRPSRSWVPVFIIHQNLGHHLVGILNLFLRGYGQTQTRFQLSTDQSFTSAIGLLKCITALLGVAHRPVTNKTHVAIN